jgi:hypothetical protein
MSLFALREVALGASIAAGLAGPWAVSGPL